VNPGAKTVTAEPAVGFPLCAATASDATSASTTIECGSGKELMRSPLQLVLQSNVFRLIGIGHWEHAELPPSGPPGLRARQQATRPRVVVKPTSERIRAMHAQGAARRVQRWLHGRPTCVTGRPASGSATVHRSAGVAAGAGLAELFEIRWSSTLCIAARSLCIHRAQRRCMTATQQCFA